MKTRSCIIVVAVSKAWFSCYLRMPLKIFIYYIKYWRRQVCCFTDTCHDLIHDVGMSLIQPSIFFWDINNLINLMHTSGLIGWSTCLFSHLPCTTVSIYSSHGDYHSIFWIMLDLLSHFYIPIYWTHPEHFITCYCSHTIDVRLYTYAQKLVRVSPRFSYNYYSYRCWRGKVMTAVYKNRGKSTDETFSLFPFFLFWACLLGDHHHHQTINYSKKVLVHFFPSIQFQKTINVLHLHYHGVPRRAVILNVTITIIINSCTYLVP